MIEVNDFRVLIQQTLHVYCWRCNSQTTKILLMLMNNDDDVARNRMNVVDDDINMQ